MSIGYTTDKTRLSAAIASIKRRGNNLDRDIWAAAVGSIGHAQEHGDLSLFSSLLSAMPKGSRVQTLIQWAQHGAPLNVAFNKDKNAYKVSVDRKSESFTESDRSDWDLGSLAETPWYEYKKSPEEKIFDLVDLIAMIEKIAEGKRKGSTEWAMDGAAVAHRVLSDLYATKVSEALGETAAA
jgi:hypothetical protein